MVLPLSSQELNLQSHNFASLACCIKQNYSSESKQEDPKVRIQIPFDNISFNLLKRNGVLLDMQVNGHQVYGIKEYEDLDELFGEQWHLRIVNINGDFSCALLKTIQFYATCPKPILDFSINTTDAKSYCFKGINIITIFYCTTTCSCVSVCKERWW